MVAYEWHKLPVSHNKLRLVAKLARGLYWREAMLQLEFCRKNMAVMVKNCISDSAVLITVWDSGLRATFYCRQPNLQAVW